LNNIETMEYKDINEVMYKYNHKSGLNVFVIPKKGYSKKYAVFATHFGSINTKFSEEGNRKVTTVPEGIAHFLEHKLFDQKDGSIMDKFSLLGSEPNAYTSFNQTVYLFSCTDKFNENFGLLLNFVQNPYFVDESIEKEKSIIKQEINMYKDNANWRSFFNFLKALYKNNNVRNEILGTSESIDNINKEILLKCYNNFYNLTNMVVCIVGDVDKDEVFAQIEKQIENNYKSETEVRRIFPKEPEKINVPYIEEKMQISMPLFQIGYKDNFINNIAWSKNQINNIVDPSTDELFENKTDLLKREISIKILLEMIMGRSSSLYLSLYEQGLINNTFDFDYTAEENYAYSVISGESQDPIKVKEIILQNINEKFSNLNEQDFVRVRNAMYGRNLRWFNSVETISGRFVSSFFKDNYLFDYFNLYDKIDFEYIINIMKEHFKHEYFAMSVIMPS